MRTQRTPDQRFRTARVAVAGGFLLLSFIVSLGAFVLFNDGRIDRTLFFPGARTAEVGGELRSLPRLDNTREDLQLLMREIILGPTEIRHGRLLPRGTQLRSVIVRDNKAFINFSEGILFEAPEQQLALEEVLDVLRRTVRYNFREIDRVVFTINGQLPSQPFFELPPPPPQDTELSLLE